MNAESGPLRVESLTVQTGRLVCTVVVPDPAQRYSSPALAARLRASLPELPCHTCVNDQGPVLGAVMADTSLPHLLEHVVIALQVREETQNDRTFVGITQWLDEGAGRAQVQVSFRDDLSALRAFNRAVKLLNDAVLTCNL